MLSLFSNYQESLSVNPERIHDENSGKGKNLIGKNNEKAGYHRSDIRTNENTSAHHGGTINN